MLRILFLSPLTVSLLGYTLGYTRLILPLLTFLTFSGLIGNREKSLLFLVRVIPGLMPKMACFRLFLRGFSDVAVIAHS